MNSINPVIRLEDTATPSQDRAENLLQPAGTVEVILLADLTVLKYFHQEESGLLQDGIFLNQGLNL